MESNLPPVRHSSTELPGGGASERSAGATAAVVGAGVLLIVVSFTVAYVLMSGYGSTQEHTAGLASNPTVATAAATPFATPPPTPVPTPATTEPSPSASRLLTADGTPKEPAKAPSSSSSLGVSLPTGPFALKNAVTGTCLRVLKDVVSSRTCKSGEKAWQLQKTRTVDGVDLYRLRRTSGAALCLDVGLDGIQPEGTKLGVFTCVSPATKDNQEFRIEAKTSAGRSGYILKNYKNQLCVDVSGYAKDKSDRKNGIDVTLYRCQDKVFGYDDHIWTFS